MSSGQPTQKKTDPTVFPKLYQAQHREYQDDIPFWLSLAQEQGSPILELGCGTGRVFLPLAEADYTCYGLDHDPGMLAILQQHTSPGLRGKIHTVLADITTFQIEARFPLIILPCNTYSTLNSVSRAAALGCIFQHLEVEGLFCASIPNPDILNALETSDQIEVEMLLTHPDSGNPVQVSTWIERTSESLNFHWFYDHLKPDGRVDRITVSTSHDLASSSQFLDGFKKAGFSIIDTYGDFDRSPHNENSPNLIIVVQKK